MNPYCDHGIHWDTDCCDCTNCCDYGIYLDTDCEECKDVIREMYNKGERDMTKKSYIVVRMTNYGGLKPAANPFVHDNANSAQKEAHKLATVHNASFAVLAVIGHAQPIVTEWVGRK